MNTLTRIIHKKIEIYVSTYKETTINLEDELSYNDAVQEFDPLMQFSNFRRWEHRKNCGKLQLNFKSLDFAI